MRDSLLLSPPLMSDEARPFDPTPRRIQEARERGVVPRSRLLSAAVGLSAVVAATALGAPGFVRAWRASVTALWAGPFEPGRAWSLVSLGVSALAPVLGAAVLGALVAGLFQVGPLLAPGALRPDLARLSPAEGWRRVRDGALGRVAPFGLGLVLIAIGAGVLYAALADTLGRTAVAPAQALDAGGVVLGALAWRAAGVLLVAGALAWTYARWRWWQGLRMSRRDRLEEQRRTSGDPQARRRRARERRQRALRLAPAEAAQAAALLVEGERQLVAVAWDGGDDGPRMLIAARGPAADALRLSGRAVPRVRDAALAAQLGALESGAAVPRGIWRRLAEALVRATA